MILDKYRIKIKCNIDKPGVYLFDDISGTGKTRLTELLKTYRSYGENVLAYSYEDYMSNSNIGSINDGLVVIDRYDMIAPNLVSDIRKLAKNNIVLIDYKGSDIRFTSDDKFCAVELHKNSIDIEEYGRK